MNRSTLLRSALLSVAALAAVLSLPAASTQASGITANLSCEPDVGGAFCLASPFDPSFSYTWSATGGLGVSGSGFLGDVDCNGSSGGTVTVTITAPGVGTDSASRFVSCRF